MGRRLFRLICFVGFFYSIFYEEILINCVLRECLLLCLNQEAVSFPCLFQMCLERLKPSFDLNLKDGVGMILSPIGVCG